MVDSEVSHDHITGFLSGNEFSSKDLGLHIKLIVRQMESAAGGVFIFDDTIHEKAWTDENEIMCWYFDHCAGRMVRGISLLNAVTATMFQLLWTLRLPRNPFNFATLKRVR